MSSSREVVLYYVVPAMTVLFAVVAIADSGRRADMAGAFAVCLLGDWILLKTLDARLDRRAELRHDWESPELVTEAARLGLAPVSDPTDLLGMGGLRLEADRRALGDPVTTIGIFDGAVEGYDVVVAETTNRNGPITTTVVAIARLRTATDPMQLTARGTWTSRRTRRAPTRLEQRFKVTPDGALERVAEIGDELVERAPTTSFRAADRFLVARLATDDPLAPAQLEPRVTTLVHLARCLEGGSDTGIAVGGSLDERDRP
jgi:hypothetical protein